MRKNRPHERPPRMEDDGLEVRRTFGRVLFIGRVLYFLPSVSQTQPSKPSDYGVVQFRLLPAASRESAGGRIQFFTSGQGFVDSQMLLSPLLPSHTVLEAPRETELGVVPCPTDSPTSSSLASSHPSMTDLTGLASSNSNDASTRRASPVDNTLGAVPVASAGANKRHRRSYSAPLHGGRWDQLIEQATGARLGLELGCWWVTVCKWSSSNSPTPNPNTDPSNIPTPNPNTDPDDQ